MVSSPAAVSQFGSTAGTTTSSNDRVMKAPRNNWMSEESILSTSPALEQRLQEILTSAVLELLERYFGGQECSDEKFEASNGIAVVLFRFSGNSELRERMTRAMGENEHKLDAAAKELAEKYQSILKSTEKHTWPTAFTVIASRHPYDIAVRGFASSQSPWTRFSSSSSMS